MNRPVTAILLAIIALICTALPANAGIAAGDVPASAVRHDVTAAGAQADAPQKVGETRGALLYSTHCAACHTSEIHWREKKLVTDMNSLELQVRRWQASIGLGWTEDEIADAVRYLNAVFYGFPDAEQKGFLEGEKPLQALRKN